MKLNLEDKQEENLPVIMPITRKALETAQTFAKHTPNPKLYRQIYWNTLAVYVLHQYLESIGVPTDLSKSDSWNPVVRLAFNAADIYIPELGYLECRSVKEGDLECYVPLEAQSDRIGFVVVEIDEQQRVALLLGFSPNITGETIPLNQLQSATHLLDYLTQIPEMVVNLCQWLAAVFQKEWRSPEDVLSKRQLVTAGSSKRRAKRESSAKVSFPPVKRAKVIEWGEGLNNPPIILLIHLKPQEEDLEVRVQVFRAMSVSSVDSQSSFADLDSLPPNLKLKLLNAEGQMLEEVISRSDFLDDSIQIAKKFSRGEQFSCEISLDGAKVTENFVT